MERRKPFFLNVSDNDCLLLTEVSTTRAIIMTDYLIECETNRACT